jgi:acetyl-CoA carboxylase/biotin carboxylase 1
LVAKYATRLLKLRVDEIEVKLRIIDPVQGPVPVRLMASSATGGWLTREVYREYLDPVTGQTQQYCTLVGDQSVCVLDPYPTSSILQTKRATARRVGSTYANDFLGLMEVALLNIWQSYIDSMGKAAHLSAPPAGLFTFEELVLSKDGSLRREKRFPGSNKIGMLAWHVEMKTPHYPNGREAVIIANDVTVQSGSFGVAEVSC